MTYSFINRFVSGENVYYDLIIEDEGWSERLNSIKVPEGEEEAIVETVYQNLVNSKRQEANRRLVLFIVESMKYAALDMVKAGGMDLTKMAAINNIIMTNLSPLGIHIDTPDLIAILSNRIEETIGKVNELYNNIVVTDEIKNITLYTINQIAEVMNGNA